VIAEPEGRSGARPPLRPLVFGLPHRHLRETGSTNDVARAVAEGGAPSGTIVTAARQSAGRGRRGRVWAAPEGKALLFSGIVRDLGREQGLLPLAVPVAVCEAIESVGGARCEIKWPNDVWIDERKVAGVLIEARLPEWAVIGVGVNVSIEPGEFPEDLRWPATSVGSGASVESVRDGLCATLERWTVAPRAEVTQAFGSRDALAGRAVEWERGTGVARGVDADGNLLVERDDGATVSLGSGEVSLALG
jgi:BirA family transcriptional regulator, biotin operon repressor / biotin---[acetyl-CoA-carboxylase] ligase